MGVIIRQGLKTTAINFLGVLVGIASTLFIYPLNLEGYGLASNLYTISSFLAAFIGMGISSSSVKFFHLLKNPDEKFGRGYLNNFIIILLSSVLIFLLILYLFRLNLYSGLDNLNFNSKVISDYEWVIAVLIFLLALVYLLSAYSSNFGRVAFPSAVSNFSYKVYLPLIIGLVYFGYLNLSHIPYAVTLFYIVAVITILLYLRSFNVLDNHWGNFEKFNPIRKSLFNFIAVNSLTSLGALITFRIDTIMITGFLGFVSNGIYGLAMTIPAVMDIPNQALSSVAGPVLAKSWNEKNYHEIEKIYKKSSINLLIIGLLICIGGYYCFEDIGRISSNPDAFEQCKNAFFILCIAKLIDMLTSINGPLIGYSNKYWVNLIFILILAVTNILLNYYFIPKYGITGAALATLISILIFNILKGLYIFFSFKMQPFTKETIFVLLIGGLVVSIIYFIPKIENPYLSLIIKGGLITIFYAFLIYKSRVSSDANNIVDNLISRIKAR